MKNLVFVFGVLFAMSMFSCTDATQNNDEQNDSLPIPVVEDTLMQVTGVAIDGATNSISLLVGDDTLSFDYPDLDSEHRDSWYINDTVTVKYYVTQDGDSVTDVINEANA